MKIDCSVIRDLLPLYADEVCSEESRGLVREHLQECPDCKDMLRKLQETEIENNLQDEKNDVVKYGTRWFKRRSTIIGATVAGFFMIPVLVSLIVNFSIGMGAGWFFLVFASLCIPASFIIVPFLVPEDKVFWMFCSFCVSLILLLCVTCIYSGGDWFWIASSAVLFGLAIPFLPGVVNARPVERLIGSTSKLLIVLALDAALFVNMMNAIIMHDHFSVRNIFLMLGVAAGFGLVVTEVLRKKGESMKIDGTDKKSDERAIMTAGNNLRLRGIGIACLAVLIAGVIVAVGKPTIGSCINNTSNEISYSDAEMFTSGGVEISEPVKNLDIGWLSGNINIIYHNDPTVVVSETSEKEIGEKNRMRWRLDGDTLRVRYAESGTRMSFESEKNLTITLPEGTSLDSALFETTSGSVEIPSLHADSFASKIKSGNINASVAARDIAAQSLSGDVRLKFEEKPDLAIVGSASGEVHIEGEDAETIRISSASGDIYTTMKNVVDFGAFAASGNIHAILEHADRTDIKAVSGDVDVKIAEFETLKVKVTSGNVHLFLPEECRFSASLKTVLGSITNELPQSDGSGDNDNTPRVNIETVLGTVTISPLQK